MKRKMFVTLAVLVLLILNASSIWTAEITIDWRQKLDSGRVDDLHFMPGQEQFILSSGQVQKFTEIRSCEDGSIIKYYPFGGYQFEFTPDSSKLIFMSGPYPEIAELQLRNLSDMSLLTQYQLPKDEELPYSYFDQMAVDPVRPFIYVIWVRTNNSLTNTITKRKILIYNYETLQPAGELTTDADSSLMFSEVAVSKDGKYLAAMNYGISKLVVWSLDTRQKIVDKFISDQNTGKFSEPADIKFSELNTDKIFFTGVFYKKNNVGNFGGLCIFSISENRIIDSTFAIPPYILSANSKIFLFSNETKFWGSGESNLKIIDMKNSKIEYQKTYSELDYIGSGEKLIYNENNKYFIGVSHLIDKFRFQPNTTVPCDNPKEVIFPNPTTGNLLVNIPESIGLINKGQLFDNTGKIIKNYLPHELQTTNSKLILNINDLNNGIYILRLTTNNNVLSYKIILEK